MNTGPAKAEKKPAESRPAKRKYLSVSQSDLPHGRKGKHNSIVHELLDEIAKLAPGQALKIALSELPDTKANVRSALSRASQKRGLDVSTSSDDKHFYMWIVSPVRTPGRET
jgi:hypothetical protein